MKRLCSSTLDVHKNTIEEFMNPRNHIECVVLIGNNVFAYLEILGYDN